MTVILLSSLSYLSYNLVQQAKENILIEDVVKQQVDKIPGVELVEWSSNLSSGTLNLNIVIRTNRILSYQDSVNLQKAIADGLQRPVAVIVNQVLAARLDPLIPPTFTATPTNTATAPSQAPAQRLPTHPPPRPLSPHLPAQVPHPPIRPLLPQHLLLRRHQPWHRSRIRLLPGLRLRQSPGGPVIASLREGEQLEVLYGKQVIDGLVWVEVQDKAGRVGWIPAFYLQTITQTPTRTPVPTITATPTPTQSPVSATFHASAKSHTPSVTATP